MGKQITIRNQHYVPRFYLKYFTNNKKELERFDCKNRQILLPKGPKGICSEDFYYGVQTGTHDKTSQQVEKYFRALESYISSRIKPIVAKIMNSSEIQPIDKWNIAFLMSMIWIRGPGMREQINRMAGDAIKHIAKSIFSTKPKLLDEIDKKVGWKDSDGKIREQCRSSILNGYLDVFVDNSQHMRMFRSIDNFANLFYGQDWIVYISEADRTFITTDNPVAMVVPETKGFYGPSFLQRTHYFALTPKICIVACEPHSSGGEEIHRKTLLNKDCWQIVDLNFLLGGYANQYAYSCDRKNFEDILSKIKTIK